MVDHEGFAGDAFGAYRAATERIARQVAVHADVSGRPRVRRLLEDEPALMAVLDALPDRTGPAPSIIEATVDSFRPSVRSNARTPADLLRILLLQQIDVLWWSAAAPFADDDAVHRSPELVSLPELRRAGTLGFRFSVSPRTLPDRAWRYARRRCAPDRTPRSSGLSYPLARPAMVGLLNDVGARFAAAAPDWRRGLWVNCIQRSEAAQQRLRDLGYSALAHSAHCAGYAADIEMDWLERHGRGDALRRVLLDLRDDGRLNVIDEGQAWHVCLSPAWAAHYDGRPAAPARITVPTTDGTREEVAPCAG